VDDTSREKVIERFGWQVEPPDASEHDPAHASDPKGWVSRRL
jgi:hypothetical protein